MLIIAVFFMVTGFVFQRSAFSASRADHVQQNPQPIPISASVSKRGVIESFSLSPSRKDGGWLIYRGGAKAVLRGENLLSAEIRYFSTGTGMGDEFPKGKVLGAMSKINGTTWEFFLPQFFLATHFWVEAVVVAGNRVKGPDLGNVGYEETASLKLRSQHREQISRGAPLQLVQRSGLAVFRDFSPRGAKNEIFPKEQST